MSNCLRFSELIKLIHLINIDIYISIDIDIDTNIGS